MSESPTVIQKKSFVEKHESRIAIDKKNTIAKKRRSSSDSTDSYPLGSHRDGGKPIAK